MTDTYRYGIDLGTTNSVIARCEPTCVQVFTNPGDFGRQTLPSAVAWKKDRLLVGVKARELSSKPQGKGNSFAGFKRKMGTSESFPVQTTGITVTPTDLSGEVLKELRRFVADDPNFTSAIVTVPASFDLMQSNATVEAAHKAGIKNVALLQEPIAASLAFANEVCAGKIEGKWLVYDLGGGTFDVALVEAGHDHLRVIDHEGDNFLGGRDFDSMLLREYVIPEIERRFKFTDKSLLDSLVRASGQYNHVHEALLMMAEGSKIALSTRESVEFELDVLTDFKDDEGEDITLSMTITRSDFEKIIKPAIDRSIAMVNTLLTRNRMSGRDLAFTLLVGGSTYIPMVRKRIEETLEVKVRSDVDPTTAVAVGAAYYAGTKAVDKSADIFNADAKASGAIILKSAYQRSTKDPEEYYAAKVEGWRPGLRYRIVRKDGGYDSGWKPLEKRITEDLPIKTGEYNFFNVTVSDESGHNVQVIDGEISIAQGRISVAGQPLSEDLILEVDHWSGGTVCDPIIRRGSILPAEGRPSNSYTTNKTIIKDSNDEMIIRVLYGDAGSRPEACLLVGSMVINGKKITRDLFQGASLDIHITISENQAVKIGVSLPDIEQTFEDTFKINARKVDITTLGQQIEHLSEEAASALVTAESTDDFQKAKALKELIKQIEESKFKVQMTSNDDTTDARYITENEKCRHSCELGRLTADYRLKETKKDYEGMYNATKTLVESQGNDADRHNFNAFTASHSSIVESGDVKRIQDARINIGTIYWTIKFRDYKFLVGWFEDMCNKRQSMNNENKAAQIIQQGKAAIQEEDVKALLQINFTLDDLLPNKTKESMKYRVGFSK